MTYTFILCAALVVVVICGISRYRLVRRDRALTELMRKRYGPNGTL